MRRGQKEVYFFIEDEDYFVMGSELDGPYVTISIKYDLRSVRMTTHEQNPNCLSVSLANDEFLLVFEDYTKSLQVLDMIETNKQQKKAIDSSIVDSFLGTIEACLN